MTLLSLNLASGEGPLASVDPLGQAAELIAAQGVYFLLAVFLFYLWQRSLRDYQKAAEEDKNRLWDEHRSVKKATYTLMAVAIPVWVFATFFYQPKTVLWGSVANLRQMSIDPQPGEVSVQQQIAPEQSGLKFYTHLAAGQNATPPTVTLEWALVEDGRQGQVPFIFRHTYKEWSTPPVPTDPRTPSPAPKLVSHVQDWRFFVTLPAVVIPTARSLDYAYHPNAGDPDRKLGTIDFFVAGKPEPVDMVQVAMWNLPAAPRPPLRGIEDWFRVPSVYAQAPAARQSAARVPQSAEADLVLMGSSDLNLQIQGAKSLKSLLQSGKGWDSVRKAIGEKDAAAQHTLLLHNLNTLMSSPDVKCPADITLSLGLALYAAGDFRRAAPLLNAIDDQQLSRDTVNYYYRGVANLQTGNYKQASADLNKYLDIAPDANSKNVARQVLLRVQEKSAGK